MNPARPTGAVGDGVADDTAAIQAALDDLIIDHLAAETARQVAIVRRYFGDILPDAHTVAFSQMSAEAEAELAAWDEMLRGRNGPKSTPRGPQNPA